MELKERKPRRVESAFDPGVTETTPHPLPAESGEAGHAVTWAATSPPKRNNKGGLLAK